MAINQLERGIFLSLFNRGGYVLDFSTNDFDNFTLMSVGVALCERYQLSKGKSLTAYLNECPDGDTLKLLNDLLEYYELHYEDEYTKPDESGSSSYSSVRYSAEYARYYRKARAVLDRENAGHNPFEGASDYLKEQFSSDYMTVQIDSFMNMRETNPTEAIGKAKELRGGNDVALIANGDTVRLALKAAEELEQKGIAARVLDMHTVKPLDREAVLDCIHTAKAIVTVEDHNIYNGLGSAVAELVSENSGARMRRIGIQDQFGQSAPYERLLEMNGITVENIVKQAEELLEQKNRG